MSLRPGDLVKLRSDMTHVLDLYETWGETGSILSEVGEILPGQVGVVLETETDSYSRTGAKITVEGVCGWIYQEFLEKLK